ncbi:OhcA (octaheme, c-type cytochrome) [Desulfatibacillum aliphaticivorans]|uniref:OhcA (Octaheme, c-type cytochrome) n=1 Tax=Desulfatibacillum aliphaticivorans TaxID=218208 RepID=B8F943_DESAL|nr:tetrathionate reductase family octaheme c-type cytochrome [Desulfatibacillum aliphaticivorans]ACL02789.1 OhcA (octaheme, c-type cytochrome) [Desulfatibacillum aliphaticivorans]
MYRKLGFFALAACLAIGLGLALSASAATGDGREGPKPPFGNPNSANNTADHSKFEVLQKEFKSGPEVTKACLSCHNEAAEQFQKTIHWKWLCPAAKPEAKLGKAGYVVNNFCININSNEPRCTSCHAGYGYKDKNFDFSVQENVDCLVCHEQTGTYKKFPPGAGYVVKEPTMFGGKEWLPPDFAKVAQSVALPTRKNCGTCHFYGGGGEGVKHGDLDASLYKPKWDLDVHMNVDGENFTCTRCHTTVQHAVAGRCYKSTPLTDRRSLLDSDLIHRITCYSCHSEKPHKTDAKLNDHTDKVSCQACHIPEFAREHSTKMSWDWSTAGKKNAKGKPLVIEKDGRHSYNGMKGDFVWKKNVVPEYKWFNGKLTYLTLTDKIDPAQQPIEINKAHGSYDDPDARIFPFKVHKGKQPFDKVNNTFVVPHLFGKDKNAYWKGYNWANAIQTGMDYTGLPYSGEFDFISTEYMYQTTHMVAPKEKALSCDACHAPQGRLAKLTGFYLPGRDANGFADYVGWLIVVASLLGVLFHGLVRIASTGNGKEE